MTRHYISRTSQRHQNEISLFVRQNDILKISVRDVKETLSNVPPKNVLKISVRDIPIEYFCLFEERHPRGIFAICISTGYLCMSQKKYP